MTGVQTCALPIYFISFWIRYFDLDCDYQQYIERINPRDRYLTEAVKLGNGIRILQQDLWEMIITFLISQGDIVEHKVFGRGKVLKVKPAAGDQIVEISFEKVGVKKTMANFAPLVKITTEE